MNAALQCLAIADALNMPVWCHGSSACGADGLPVDPDSGLAERWCASALIAAATPERVWRKILLAVEAEIDRPPLADCAILTDWNDQEGRTQNQVRDAFYAAAMRLGWKP